MPELIELKRRKNFYGQSAEISIDIASYVMAYKNYKSILDVQGGSTRSLMERAHKATYDDLRNRLIACLSPLTGGNLAEVYDLAMGLDRLMPIQAVSRIVDQRIQYIESLRYSAAYEALEDSLAEILSNAVDEAIAKHFSSSESTKPVSSLKAILRISIDDRTHPENIVISCFNKEGRGFPFDFLQSVSTLEKRRVYIENTHSTKLTEAKKMADIPLFIGGRGLGLAMLMRKIDEGTYLEHDRKHARQFNKAAVSHIELSNQIDVVGHIEGAVIKITTSKTPAMKALAKAQLAYEMDLDEIDSQYTIRGPLAIKTDFDVPNHLPSSYFSPNATGLQFRM